MDWRSLKKIKPKDNEVVLFIANMNGDLIKGLGKYNSTLDGIETHDEVILDIQGWHPFPSLVEKDYDSEIDKINPKDLEQLFMKLSLILPKKEWNLLNIIRGEMWDITDQLVDISYFPSFEKQTRAKELIKKIHSKVTSIPVISKKGETMIFGERKDRINKN